LSSQLELWQLQNPRLICSFSQEPMISQFSFYLTFLLLGF
jgi:hypothetical protein